MKGAPLLLDKPDLTIYELVETARNNLPAGISPEAEKRIETSRALVDKWIREEKVIYGITTGFGALCNVRIPEKDTAALQKNILMSHSAGVGEPLPEDAVRAMTAVRIRDLSMGCSGVRLETVKRLMTFLNKGITPVVPEKGSVGASGDLCPMAHLGLVLLGLGEAYVKGKRVSGKEALEYAGLNPLELLGGEGLGLINGTQMMTGFGVLLAYDAEVLSKTTDIACAMSLEVLMGSQSEFDPRIHNIRPHNGQVTCADNMRRLTRDSGFIRSHSGCARIQDAYTLRCSPQIHGAGKDAVNHFKNTIITEFNSSTTNPLIFPDTESFILGGNFHGQPIALTADYLAMAVSEFGNVSERRVERLVNPQLSELPAFLVEDGGLNSGFMIAQYTAAALVSENKVLAHPASVDSIPTSANKEDHVSMGSISVRKCREILENVRHIIAIELLCAAQAMDLINKNAGYEPGVGSKAAYRCVRKAVPYLESDRILSTDIERIVGLIHSEELIRAVEKETGPLG